MFTYHIEGQFHFMFILFVPLGLISIFLYVGRVHISCGLLPTRFCLKFPIKLLLSKRVNFRFTFTKNHLCHWKDNKKLHITPYYDMVTLIFEVLVEL